MVLFLVTVGMKYSSSMDASTLERRSAVFRTRSDRGESIYVSDECRLYSLSTREEGLLLLGLADTAFKMELFLIGLTF
ncbi:hypothetical protein [Myroides guanonis]|uniref:Uncharacterized protein n=1 Tax=Myroides guanonis TaxID=1150112 RepID=A0A1I3RPA1_9FLAO|nr:hypothetical protein [Myroides guanonis]SFJ47087.1 hypothetical protein SAMN04487893_10881 [Myroides guanonis]